MMATVHQLDNITIGLSLLKLTVFIGIGSIIGIATSKISPLFTMLLASFLISIGTYLYSININIPTNEINIIFYLTGLGYGLFIVPIHNTGLHNIKENIRGITSSMISLSRMVGMIFGLSIMTTIGTARFAELVTGMQIFSMDPKVQQTINDEINVAGLEVFNEILIGAFIFTILNFISVLVLCYWYSRTKIGNS